MRKRLRRPSPALFRIFASDRRRSFSAYLKLTRREAAAVSDRPFAAFQLRRPRWPLIGRNQTNIRTWSQ